MRRKARGNLLSLLVLTGIVVVAFGLRVWGVGFGLPYVFHVDEPAYVSAALNLGAGVIGRQTNPTGFVNLLFSEYTGFFVLGRLAGRVTTVLDFAQAYRADPSVFVMLARMTSVILGALTALVVYHLGRIARGRLVGWPGALFMAVAFLHVRDSHFSVPDVTMVFFLSLSVLFCLLAVRRPERWFLWLAAATGGFAIAVKWSAWPLVAPLLLAASSRLSRTRTSRQEVLVALLCFAGGAVAGGFQLLIAPGIYLEYALREQRSGGGGGFGAFQIDTVAGWVFYLKTLTYGLGIALLIFGLAGSLRRVIQALRTRDMTSLVLVAFPVLYFLVMGASRHYFARYALPLVPFLALFAAEAIVDLSTRLGARRMTYGVALGGMLALAAVLEPLARDIAHDRIIVRQDTRVEAKIWIEANIPEGSKIAVDWLIHGPPLSTSARQFPGCARVYDLTSMDGTGLADHLLPWYQENGFHYLITSSFLTDLSLVEPKWDAKRRQFYASLDRELELVKEFRPYTGDTPPAFIFDEIYGPVVSLWQRDRPGPTLRIYRLRDGDAQVVQTSCVGWIEEPGREH